MKARAILFDLFGTVVDFEARVPTLQVAGTEWRSTMAWVQPLVETLLPATPFDQLLQALLQTTEAIVRARPPEYLEVSSPERFRRALERIGIAEPIATEVGRQLALAHMQQIAAVTFLPEGHKQLLAEIAADVRIGLVSNFDHGPTARQILADLGVSELFEATVVSDDFGRRKPHPAIFQEALRQLDVGSEEAIFVGDSLSDDVAGARNAGLRSVWIDARGQGVPPGKPAPDQIVRRLTELRSALL